MALTELTHVWIEAPFLSDALKQMPAHVNLLYPAAPPADPIAAAQPVQAILASSLLQYNGQLMDRLPNLRIIARTGIAAASPKAQIVRPMMLKATSSSKAISSGRLPAGRALM